MTPDWLFKHSTITKPFTVQPKYLEFLAGKAHNERLLQAELIAPNILTATDSVVVTLTIAMDTVLADSYDHDPMFGVSDGTSFIGFVVIDKRNYATEAPCYKWEGDITGTILQNIITDSTGSVSSRHFSNVVTMQIKPNDQWGSCHTGHDEGHVRIETFQHRLDLTKGLYFEMYRHETPERYRIEYIAAEVYLD